MNREKKYHIIEPEVAGGLGENTVMDRTTHPPLVSKLNYEFDDWFGDALVEGFPCFIVTEAAMHQIVESKLSGAEFDDVEISKSDDFDDLCELELPKFLWLKVTGKQGRDDFWTMPDGRLVVSKEALDVLRPLGLKEAEWTEF